MFQCLVFNLLPNHSPAPTLQRLDHTLGPAHNRPLTALVHEIHCRLYLRTRRELPVCQFFYSPVRMVSHCAASAKVAKKNS